MIFKIKTESHKESVISYIKGLPLDKRGFKGRIDPIASQRSTRQNAYMHYVFTMIAHESGEAMHDVKIYYRTLYLKAVKKVFDEEIEYTQSTTELTTIKQEDFMSKIRMHASQERGIYVPLPNEMTYEDELD